MFSAALNILSKILFVIMAILVIYSAVNLMLVKRLTELYLNCISTSTTYIRKIVHCRTLNYLRVISDIMYELRYTSNHHVELPKRVVVSMCEDHK